MSVVTAHRPELTTTLHSHMRAVMGAGAVDRAESITPTGGAASDESFAELTAEWSAAEIVEITAVTALFNYFNRFAEALRIPKSR